MLTTKEVRRRVAAIRKAVQDDERAHGMENTLYIDVLRAIATHQCEDPASCAKAALATEKLDFNRWTA